MSKPKADQKPEKAKNNNDPQISKVLHDIDTLPPEKQAVVRKAFYSGFVVVPTPSANAIVIVGKEGCSPPQD